MSTSGRVRRGFGACLAVLALTAAAVLGGAAWPTTGTTAEAADLSDFDPGLIISDSVFYDTTTMTAASIQTFLDATGASCSAAGGSTCLKDYRETTTTRAATTRCTGTYTGASNETAAQIIAKVAVACGINPQVLIVMLQKEQGLVTASAGRTASTYQRAMGYACPDTAACDTAYYGFFNQVYSASRQMQNYAANPTGYAHRAGVVNQVRYHPTASCGTSAVYIQNQATASLYNYTPYQPNTAALAAGYGTGDSCSSYGNRNFWNYFTDWFGSTTQRAPVGAVDQVSAIGAGTVRVRGWALDPDTSDSIGVHVYVDGRSTQAITASTSRADVAAAYGRGAAHGFDTTVTMGSGTHQVCAYAIDSAGGPNTRIGCQDVTVTNAAPIGTVDAVTATGPGTVQVRGWALDPDTTASIRVHVYVDGKSTQAITAAQTRNDVAAVHGTGAAHGYSTSITMSSGNHQVCVYAIDSTGGSNPQIGCKTVSVNNKTPIGTVDAVTATGPDSIRMNGWALDPDTTASIRVHVYVDGRNVQTLTADQTRNDVDRAYGKGAAHGYSTSLTVAAGTHQVCVSAIDATGGSNPQIGCRTVTVTNRAPIGALDSAQGGMERFTVSGWALDPDTTASIRVHVYVDGRAAQAITADQTRNDVDRAYGLGAAHGYSITITATPGTHEVCVYAIDTTQGNTRVGCRTVVVNGTAFGVVDQVTATATGIRVRGWALDPDTTSSIRVHVWVDGQWQAEVRADLSRPDVATAYGLGALHGFDTTIAGTWSTGSHQVCVYAIDSTGGTNPRISCQSATVS